MNILIKTLAVKLSDAEIARNAKLEHVRDLRDAGHPALHFRFAKNRTRGSWYLLNKRKWHRIGGFPDLNTKQVIAALPAVRLRVAADGAASVSGWVTVGELLDWFGDRMAKSRSLSDKRRAAGKSAISCQLKPRLDDLLLRDVSAQTLDKLLMWPAQAELSLSYVQQLYRLLAVAFRQARKLDLIPVNPMAEMKFVNFTTARILPKPARLSQHAPAFYAAGFAISISALRIIYGGGTRKAAFFESLLCGCITLSMLSGLELIGIPQSAASLIGGMIGLLGVDKVRAFADRVTNQRDMLKLMCKTVKPK